MASNSNPNDRSLEDVDLGQNFNQLRADIAALSETVARLASKAAACAKSQFQDSADRASRGANVAGEQLYENASTLGRNAVNTANVAAAQIESQIARNPVTTVLVALGVGFAIGAMSRR